MRLKPRYNPDVNQWWMCDEGRFGFQWIDQKRLTKVRRQGVDSTWDEAITSITAALAKFSPSRLAVIASTQLTNEELFLIREIFRGLLGTRVTASVPTPLGSSDDFLIKADKSPNTRGATLLGLNDGAPAPNAGPGAPTAIASPADAAAIVADVLQGRLEALWVFGHDLEKLFGTETFEKLSGKLGLLVFSGTNENSTASRAHWTLPTAAYVEKDGTFVNCHGRIQRIGRAFPPLTDSREDWNLLLEIAQRLNHPLSWRNPGEIFAGLAKAAAPFAGLSYETIGSQGVPLVRPESGPKQTVDATKAEPQSGEGTGGGGGAPPQTKQ
jgi:NADH-quinone oxidoreductase subunit G